MKLPIVGLGNDVHSTLVQDLVVSSIAVEQQFAAIPMAGFERGVQQDISSTAPTGAMDLFPPAYWDVVAGKGPGVFDDDKH